MGNHEPATATNNLFRCRSHSWTVPCYRCKYWFWHSRRWMHASPDNMLGWS